MSGYKQVMLPALVDSNGALIGFKEQDGDETMIPRFSNDMGSLLKPDGTALIGTGVGYVLPAATSTTLGGVKAGSGVSIGADGTITASGGGGGTSYTLPPATATTLGGIKVGANLSVGADGTLNGVAAGSGTGSAKVVYLSSTCTSDTNLAPYAQQAGVDQRAKVQAVLDLAKTLGSLHLVWDVKITLANVPNSDGDTLLASSNTTVVVLNGCGALQAAGSKGDMWKNANPTTNANNTASAIVDENITIDGGIWHGNREGQAVKMDVFRFSGVRNLRTVNYKIYRPSGMCYRTINIDGLINENYVLDQGVDILTAQNSVSVNTDGMHHHGPYRAGRDRNGRILNCGDDPYALNADDAWGAGTFTGRFDNVYGPIEDIKVDNLYFNGRYYGVRLLSGGSRIDNIRFRNTSGATSAYGFLIDNYLTPSQASLAGPGNVGSVEIDGWKVKNSMVDFDAGKMAMHFSAKIEQLVLKNITKSDFNNSLFPAIRIGEKANIDQLVIEMNSRNYNSGTYLTEQIDFAPGARVTQADIRLRTYAASAVNGYPVRVQSGATISLLTIDGQAPNFTGMLSNQGTVTTLQDRTTANTVAPAPTTWVLQSGSPWVEDTSMPGKLTLSTNHQGVVDSARKIANDSFGGNIKRTGTIRFTGSSTNGALHAAMIVRGANTVPWSAVTQGYAFDMFLESGGGLKLFKVTGGSQPTLGSSLVVPFALNVDYLPTFIVKGSTISLMMQRGTDNFYLQTNGTWAATVATVLSVTDTSIPAASGEVAVYAFNDNLPSNTILFTGLTEVAAP